MATHDNPRPIRGDDPVEAIPDPVLVPGPICTDNTTSTPSTHYVVNEPMPAVDAAAGATAGHHLLSRTDEHVGGEPNVTGVGSGVPRAIAFRLYTSHFLSTWNSRLFEFGAALFLTSVFPGTLLPVSVYSLVRNAGYILFAQPMGKWISKGNRLNVIRTSIVGQRVPVAVSCALLLVLERKKGELGHRQNIGVFAVVVLLAVVEKLCSTMNTISVERDWVRNSSPCNLFPLASTPGIMDDADHILPKVVVITEGDEVARRSMNARMRRIDLFCKLMGPLTISLVAIASTEIAIFTTLGMNTASVVTEYVFIEQVYKRVRGLERLRPTASGEMMPGALDDADGGDPHSRNVSQKPLLKWVMTTVLPIESAPFYFRHPAFLASFALSLLYFTVLSFSGQMITYLISVGYSSWYVGVARVGSSIFEISATWAAPFLMKKIGVIRAGIWSLAWQMACLAGALGWYFSNYDGMGTNSLFSATGLAVGVALSRMGLWGYDLSAQNIIQDEVEDEHRGTFSAVEASFQNLFEMLSFVTTIIFSRPDQFQYPVVISVAAVYTAGGLYAYFLRKRRGHLFHAPPCVRSKE